MSKGIFGGSIVAVVTPMADGGAVDNDALRGLIQWHVDSGTQGIVVAGTTGESPTLSVAEHHKLIADTIRFADGRIPVIAGVGANATSEAVTLAQHALKDGADAGLSVVPYYNKPTQEGIYRHFSAVADNADLPLYLYDIPGRCVVGINDDTLMRLAAHDNIVGVKDANGNVETAKARMDLLPDEFVMLSGDDKTAREFMLAGGDGVISVTANIAPLMMRAMCDAARAGDAAAANNADAPLAAFHNEQGAESNPIPVKFVLAECGRIPPGIRLPMTPLADKYHNAVRAAAQGLQ